MFKAILLDVDGVLIDSEKVFNVCWRKAAHLEGYPMTYEQALELRSLDSSLARALFREWYGNDDAYPAIRKTRKSIMAEEIAKEPLRAKAGVSCFLEAVKNFPVEVAIVTSSPASRIVTYLSSVGIDISMFGSVITTERVTRGKPYPDVYRYACEAIGFNPRQCMAVEDSPNGVEAAHTAGCYTVMIPDLSPCIDVLKPFVDLEVATIDRIIECMIASGGRNGRLQS